MADKIVELAAALETRLEAELGIAIDRVYAPIFDPAALASARWLLMVAELDTSNERRELSDASLAVDLALQQALPDPDARDGDAIPADWCDARLADVAAVRALFDPGGSLRDEWLADCEFKRYSQSPLYRPDLLLNHGIFTAVLRLFFYYELEG